MAAHRNEVPQIPPDEVRRLAQTAYGTATSRLENRRTEKILHNLRKASSRVRSSSTTADLRSGVSLAMESLSGIASCSVIMEPIDRAPNGLAWVRVSTNLKAPDTYGDKFFVPYLGESDAQQDFSNAVAADSDLCLGEQYAEDDISDIENTVKVSPVEGPDYSPAKQTRANKRRSQKNRETRVTAVRNGKLKVKKFSETVWIRATRRVALEDMIKTLRLKDIRSIADVVGEGLGMHSLTEIESCYKNVLYRRQAYKESDTEALLRQKQKAELLEQLKGTVKILPGEALRGDSIPFFFCRQCYIYNCLEHGTQTAKPARPPPDRTKKDTATRQGVEEIESKCPDRKLHKCWCISAPTRDAAEWWLGVEKDKTFKENVSSLVLELFASFGKDPCRISELARVFIAEKAENRLTCHRVGYLLETLAEANFAEKVRRQAPRRAKKKYRTRAPRGETESMKGGQRVDYAPCQHEGPCTAKNCRCVENGVNCEKYCSCNHNRIHAMRPEKSLPCNHAFQGCTCRSAVACVSNACVCYSYGRECDPDLCRACHDCRDDARRRSCRNVGLLMGERQRTVVGRSETHGWGAFAANSIAKGEIIGEYVGEIVSHVDADRRGRLYDEIDYSFLFNITEDWALDSTRLGNKLRYCNHHFKPNCAAKLMRVGGDVRVGLYALRDIRRHEELFFDYKYKNGPAWSMPGAYGQSASSHRKQIESAKKRAPVISNDEEEDEVIPIPKKRARSEIGEHGCRGDVGYSVRDENMSDTEEFSKENRIATRLKVPDTTKGIRGFPDSSGTVEDGLGTKSLVRADRKHRRNMVGRIDEYGSTAKQSGGHAESNGSATDDRHAHSGGGLSRHQEVPHQIRPQLNQKLPDISTKGFVASTHSCQQSKHKDLPPYSRVRNVTPFNSSDSDNYDLLLGGKRPVNGLHDEGSEAQRNAPAKKQEEPSVLRDMFGSDLESPDEEGKQFVKAKDPRSRVGAFHRRAKYGANLRLSRYTSAQGRWFSADGSLNSRQTERTRSVEISKIGAVMADKELKHMSIPHSRNQVTDDTVQGTSHKHADGKSRVCAVPSKSLKRPYPAMSLRGSETQNMSKGILTDRSSVSRRTKQENSSRTGAYSASIVRADSAQHISAEGASAAVPHINLVSDDDDSPDGDLSRDTISNSSSEGSTT